MREKRKGQSTHKSCHKGRMPVVLKQITLLRKSNVHIKDDRWWHLIYTITFMVSLHPMCIYKKRYRIYEFSALVHFKFSKIERAVISKKFSSEVCQEHSVHTVKGVMPHTVFCVSQVFSNFQLLQLFHQLTALLMLSLFPLVQLNQSTGGT